MIYYNCSPYVYQHRTKSAVYLPPHQHNNVLVKHATSGDVTMNFHCDVTIKFSLVSTETLVTHFLMRIHQLVTIITVILIVSLTQMYTSNYI